MKAIHFPNTFSRADGMQILFASILMLAPLICYAQQGPLDLTGKIVNPLKQNPDKVTVLIFVRRDCPLSARYAPMIQRISGEHSKDARFFLIFPDRSDSASDVRKYLQDFHYSIPGLRDPGHVLVKQANAQVTPEAAVFDRDGVLIYHGRIDNLYVTFGRARPQPTTHELEDAVQAAVSGNRLANGYVEGIGCYISDLE